MEGRRNGKRQGRKLTEGEGGNYTRGKDLLEVVMAENENKLVKDIDGVNENVTESGNTVGSENIDEVVSEQAKPEAQESERKPEVQEADNKQKPKKRRSRKKGLIIFVSIVACLFLVGYGFVFSYTHSKDPSKRLLVATYNFAVHTLKSKGYIFNGLDLMELLKDFGNGEVHVEGKAGINKMQSMNLSSSFTVDMVRSYSKKRMSMNSTIHVLWMKIGELSLYGENETVYLNTSILEGMDAAFPTGIDLFMRMPEFTSDIDQKWFKNNISNIIDFSNQVKFEQTGEYIYDEDGTKSEEMRMTIPKGCGHFIYELLGMEDPDYDVTVSMFLTDDNRMRRIVIDLNDVLPGACVTMDGLSVGTMIFTYELPDDERAELIMVRDADKSATINFEGKYYTNIEKVLSITGQVTWLRKGSAFEVHMTDVKAMDDKDVLADGYFTGTVEPFYEKADVFDGKEEYLYSLEEIDWKTIRNDFDSFVADIVDKMKGK